MATKEDLVDVRAELKGNIVRVSEQVASIETQIRGMRHVRLESRMVISKRKSSGKLAREPGRYAMTFKIRFGAEK